MELEELKKQWQKADHQPPLNNQNIMEILQHKSTGPLAALKKAYRKQILAMTLVPLFILATNLQHIEKTLSSALFWFYILFCISVILFARRSYQLVQKMEGQDGAVRSNLEQQINLLEKRQYQNLVGIRLALLFFILLVEVLPYFQDFRMLHTWHNLSPFIRAGAYLTLFLFQFFISRVVGRRKFGQHIDHLKALVQQMQ